MLAEILLGLVASAATVVGAGIVLARSGDTIAARTGLGGLWVGAVFLATATSLPELTTDIAAVRMGAADLAVGDLFGSGMANMLILAVISLLPGAELFRGAALENALLISFAMILTAIAAIVILMEPTAAILGVGPGSALLAGAYLYGARLIFHRTGLTREAGLVEELGASLAEEPAAAPPVPAPPRPGDLPSLQRALLLFAAGAVAILFAAPLFASSAYSLAVLTGVQLSFMGTWLVGLSTSLPELVTSLAAVRMRAYDLAVANLFGSNAFNMLLFVPLDVVHGRGPILGDVDPVHALSALVGIVLMGIGLAAVVVRARGRPTMLEPSGALMILAYLVGLALIYVRGAA